MPIYRPSELQKALHELHTRPKKSLSQNFLIDGNIVRKILNTADVTSSDVVLEIGAGLGVLTEALLETKAKVIAIEKDSLFAKRLKDIYKSLPNFQIIEGDFLEMPLQEIVKDKKMKVVANLPYHISTPCIAKLLENSSLFSSITLTLQKEYALRLVAKPNSSDYSAFTIFVAFYATPTLEFTISRTCFSPAPKVDSALVHLVPHTVPISDEKTFFKMVRSAFQQRRKMLSSSLGRIYGKQIVQEALSKMSHINARPQELTLDDFLKLFAELKKTSPKVLNI